MITNTFLIILFIPFLYYNYRLIVSDIKNKIIPNKYLLYLLIMLPLWWVVLFFWPSLLQYQWDLKISPLLFVSQIIITCLVSFILYYFWLWAAGDSKYLLVLSLFIPYIGIVPFIGNIALITTTYLLIYFIYFYLWKLVFKKQYRKVLFKSIRKDLYEKWQNYKENKWWGTLRIVMKFILIFLIVFVSIRLARVYIFRNFLEQTSNINILENIIQDYSIYIIFGLLWLFIGSLFIFKVWINYIKSFLSQRLRIDTSLIWNILIVILFTTLSFFIIFELWRNFYEISTLLVKIFTLYLWIYLIIKILIYWYKITFWIAEVQWKHIDELSEWDILDKNNLTKILGDQKILWAQGNKEWPLYPDPKRYFMSIKNPLSLKDIKKIKKMCQLVKWTHNTVEYIQTFKTIPFSHYIFIWFIITLIYGNAPFVLIIKWMVHIFSGYFQL